MKFLMGSLFVVFPLILIPAYGDLNRDVLVDGLNNPWEIVFGPDDEIYFTERDGRIWMITESGEAKVIQTFQKSGSVEGGTLGIALHPEFDKTKKIYVYQILSKNYRRIAGLCAY